MTNNTSTVFDQFAEKSDIIELYTFLGGKEPKPSGDGEFIGQAFWRGDSHASLSLNPSKNTAYDHAEAKGYNPYNLALTVTGDKANAIKSLKQCANIIDELKSKKISKKDVITDLSLDEFRELSDEQKKQLLDLRNIDYNQLNNEQKNCLKQDKEGNFCILFIQDNKVKIYQKWQPKSTRKYQVADGCKIENCQGLGGLNTALENQDLWIVEGFFDMLSMQLSDFNAITKFNAGANLDLVAEWISQNYKSFKNIYLALDDDRDGQNAVNGIIEKLGDKVKKIDLYTARITRADSEDKNDPNAIFRTRAVAITDFVITPIPKIKDYNPFDFNLNNLFKCTEELKSVKSFLTLKNKDKDKILEFYNGTINAICARQGQGKTTLMANLAIDFISQDKKVLFITLEETERRLSIKLLALACHKLGLYLPYTTDFGNMGYHIRQELQRLKTRQLEGLNDKILAGVEMLKQNLTLVSLKNDITSFERVLGELKESGQSFDVIVIDYFQRIKGQKTLSNSWETALEVADKLLDLAIKLDTVVIVGSQKNRSNKDEADTASISGGDGLSNVCNVMIDIQREKDQNKSKITIIKDRESQFLTNTSTTVEINDNYIKQETEQAKF